MHDQSTFYLFATSLAVGCATLLLTIPLRGLGRGYFVVCSLLALVLYSLALLEGGRQVTSFYFHVASAALLVVYNVTLPSHARDPGREGKGGGVARVVLVVAVLLGNTGLCLDGLARAEGLPDLGPWAGTYLALAAISSSLLLGASVVTMVLGHFYLVARGLSFDTLRRAVLVLEGALILRGALLVITTLAQGELFARRWQILGPVGFGNSHGFFLGARLLFGLLAPLVLGWMALVCARERSNQSATGILYVVVAFVLLGELVALHLLVTSDMLV